MTIDIQDLIKQRPHLKNPLELYGQWQRFHQEAAKLLLKERSSMPPADSKAYSRKSAGPVCRLFFSIFNLSPEEFKPLLQALENGEIDFMRFPLGEFPVFPSLSCTEEELAGILFLLSRPYFLALQEILPQDGSHWEGGRCPFCSARTSLASLVEGPKRLLHCSFCGTTGPYRFIGCPNCGSVDAAQLNTIFSDDEPGFRVITCDECRTYVKIVDTPILKEMHIDLADMASLPLDIVVQQKGYARMAPNPISLKKIE